MRRVVEVTGPAMAVALHALYERGGPPAVERCRAGRCGGRRSRPSPRTSATSATHAGHLVEMTDRDRTAMAAGATAMIPTFTLTGAAPIAARLEGLGGMGVTEVAFQPAGGVLEPRAADLAAAAAGVAG